MSGEPRFDVAVVGGGLVGATIACALAHAGFEIALVELQPAAEAPSGKSFDLRVSAISRASEQIFRNLGAWSLLAHARVGPFREMHVWDEGGEGSVHFDSADIGEPTLGYIVENRALQYALERRLDGFSNVHWQRPATLEGLAFEPRHVRLQLDTGELTAGLVVGADGTASRVRALAGLPAAYAEYGQHALVVNVRTERPHRETAWQRFLRTGPVAFLPLPGGVSAVVWSTVPEHAAALREMPEQAFREELEAAFAARLGAITDSGRRASFPLRRLQARAYVGARVALAGDAAHTIHPLAGQGVNLGFLDAAALAQVLRDARAAGRDPGGFGVLRRYERWRKGHNVAMQCAMDGFRWLFGSRLPPLRTVRNLGLGLTDRTPFAKRLFMEHAMGIAGGPAWELPELARPRLEA